MTIRRIRPADAAVIAGWSYPGSVPGSDFSEADAPALLEPTNLVHIVESDSGLEGMFGFGALARDSGAGPTPGVIDLGFARDPDRIGRGEGARFLGEILEFIEARGLRVTVRAFVPELNAACCRLLAGAGFRFIGRHWRTGGRTTVVYTKLVEAGVTTLAHASGRPAGAGTWRGPHSRITGPA